MRYISFVTNCAEYTTILGVNTAVETIFRVQSYNFSANETKTLGDDNIGAGVLFITQNSTNNSTAMFILPYVGSATELTQSNGYFTVDGSGTIGLIKQGYAWCLKNLKNETVSDITWTVIKLSTT